MKLTELFERLQLNEKEGSLIMLSDPQWKEKVSFPSRIYRLFEENTSLKKIQAFFCLGNKPLILFYEDPEDKHELHEAIWNLNESPIVIIIEKGTVEIFNGFAIDETTKRLVSIGGEEKLNDFTYFKLVTGETWNEYNESAQSKKRVDHRLLENIEAAQEALCNTYDLKQELSNSLLGKIIFIRYLIDREVKINFNNEPKKWANEDLCELLKNKNQVWGFFQYLQSEKDGFNGDLFCIEQGDFDSIPQGAFDLVIRLLSSETITDGQHSLFNLYNFSILPIEFISNVYEKFIGQEHQAKEGAYYTPTFLVDYIIRETVSKKLDSDDYNYNCKVLDPACGSGIFLVEALRKIIEKYNKVNNITDTNTDDYREALRTLAKDNIFGIDKDVSAIQVAIFSVYLTLLDYQKPADIDKFRFPNLLNSNLINADTFDVENEHLKALGARKIDFDFIVGNPPWKSSDKNSNASKYIKNRKQTEKSEQHKHPIAVNHQALAESFVLRMSAFSVSKTQIALIIKSLSLYNIGRQKHSKFRKYWLEEFELNQVFELAPVRKEVFNKSNDSSIAPAAIVFYKYANGKNTDSSKILHITLKPSRFFSCFQIFTITRNDIKIIQQNRLKQFDWLWKTLVYGNYLDFNFIRELKEEYPTIDDMISNQERFINGVGINTCKNPNNKLKDYSKIKNIQLLQTGSLEHYIIDYNKLEKLKEKNIKSIGNIEQYYAPTLLISEGVDKDLFNLKASLMQENRLFKYAITGIKALTADVDTLRKLEALLQSKLYSYFAINTFASIGIERERVKKNQKFSVPFIDCDITGIVSDIENNKKLEFEEKTKNFPNQQKITKYQSKVKQYQENIDDKINQALNLTNQEIDLIDYTLNITRSMIINSDKINNSLDIFKCLDANSDTLKDYAQIFINRFQKSLNKDGKRFIVEIWHTNQIIGMFFKVIMDAEYKEDIVLLEKSNNSNMIEFLVGVATEKITDRLFVQKDIRGFEKDYFYVFKPNEQRLWHKAMAHLDSDEFMDAILKSGRAGE